jgi:hypothetical protein
MMLIATSDVSGWTYCCVRASSRLWKLLKRAGLKQSSDAANMFVTRGIVTRGIVIRGIVTRGIVTRGIVTRGIVTRGIVTRGIVTRGIVTRGIVTRGIVTQPCGNATVVWARDESTCSKPSHSHSGTGLI